MDATSVEIHQLKAGLTDAEIDDGYLSSGSLAGMSTLYAFRDEDGDLAGILLEREDGKKRWSSDAFELLENEETPVFLGMSPEAFMRLCWLSISPEEIADGLGEHNVLERCGDDFGGELNVSDIEGQLRSNKESCLIAFSQYAHCDLAIDSETPDLGEVDLDYDDERESVRVYFGK